MQRATTQSFILELPLSVSLGAEHTMLVRLESARRLYNAVLGEALRRLSLMRESKAWQAARLVRDR